MKKPYIEPELSFIRFVLKNNVMFHSEFEIGGENSGWDWNDDDGELPDYP